jgi:malate/lactate dehydrogenase
MYIGFPAIVGRYGIERIVNIPMDENEKNLFENSKNIIKKYLAELDENQK